jgi:hypothetical protein
MDPFASSGEERKTHTLLGSLERANINDLALSKGPNGTCVFLPSPDGENRYDFRNVMF